MLQKAWQITCGKHSLVHKMLFDTRNKRLRRPGIYYVAVQHKAINDGGGFTNPPLSEIREKLSFQSRYSALSHLLGKDLLPRRPQHFQGRA